MLNPTSSATVLLIALVVFCLLTQVRFQLRVQDGFVLPPGTYSPLLAEIELTGVDAARVKYNDTGKISIHFRCGAPQNRQNGTEE